MRKYCLSFGILKYNFDFFTHNYFDIQNIFVSVIMFHRVLCGKWQLLVFGLGHELINKRGFQSWEDTCWYYLTSLWADW